MSTTSGLRRSTRLDGLHPVVGLADDLDVGLGVEDQLEAGADQRLVVGDQQPDGRAVRRAHAFTVAGSAT